MSHVIAVLIRSAALGAVVALYYAAMPLLFAPTPDANIGAGLIGFGVLMLAALIGGILDGRRWRFVRVALTWLVVGAVVGAGWSVVQGVVEGSGRDVILADIADFLPFCVGLVAVPACLGGALGATTRGAPVG